MLAWLSTKHGGNEPVSAVQAGRCQRPALHPTVFSALRVRFAQVCRTWGFSTQPCGTDYSVPLAVF